MSWTPLSDRVQRLPLILAGPILRRTEPDAVTVWVALRKPCQVTLSVYSTEFGNGLVVVGGTEDRSPLLQGMRSTVALGSHLHIVAVTAQSVGREERQAGSLVPGQIYVYDLAFEELALEELALEELANEELANEELTNPATSAQPIASPSLEPKRWTLHQALNSEAVPRVVISYFDHQLPSFSLPPNDLNHLKILHGSCRKPHGGESDMLAVVDGLIEQSCTQANIRPHQLFLTGDQIYGDDVADALLMALTDAGKTLLGWEEVLPHDGLMDLPDRPSANLADHLIADSLKPEQLKPEQLKPGQRSQVAEALGGFTAGFQNQPERAKSHLFSAGEYFAIYLFSWSDVLWTEFPKGSEVYRRRKQAKAWDCEVKNLQDLVYTLWRVRRVLANIPTYMIFDDHDVSDDWYLNQAWCLQVLGRSLGRRTVQNALLAYAVCQAWGNTPHQFEANQVGDRLLQAASVWFRSGGTDRIAEDEISRCLGLPQPDPTTCLPQMHRDGDVLILDRDPNSIQWHYTVKGSCHEVIVLDTRTWRGYPIDEPPNAPPMLLSPTAFDRQLRQPLQQTDQLNQLGESRIEATLVVAPTNLVSLEAIDRVQHWNLKQGKVFDNDVGDAWNINKYAFSKLLETLFEQRDRIIILSGDIHYGSVVSLHYWARSSPEKGFGWDEEKPHVLVQLTASALKNTELKTRLVHTKIKSLVPEDAQDWVGWVQPPELLQIQNWFGIRRVKPLPSPNHRPVIQRIYRKNRARSPWNVAVTQPQFLPNWRYHIDWIKRQPAQVAIDRLISTYPRHQNGGQSLLNWLKRLWNNRWLQEGTEVVGLNNIGLVQFDWSPQTDHRTVIQNLYWYAPWRSGTVVFSRYVAPLNLENPPPSLEVIEQKKITRKASGYSLNSETQG